MLVDKQLFPQSCRHWLNKVWQFAAQLNCAILFFGMGVKLPAKLVVIEESRIIAATTCFICTPYENRDPQLAPQLNERASK
jgi:hypothetical protein